MAAGALCLVVAMPAESAQSVRVSFQVRSPAAGVLLRVSLDGVEIHAGATPPAPAAPDAGAIVETVAARDLEPGSRHLLTVLAPGERQRAQLTWAVAGTPQWIVVHYDPGAGPDRAPTLGFSIQDGAAAGK